MKLPFKNLPLDGFPLVENLDRESENLDGATQSECANAKEGEHAAISARTVTRW